MRIFLIIANSLLAAMFVFAISQALAYHGFTWCARDVLYFGSTSLSLAVLAANVIFLARSA